MTSTLALTPYCLLACLQYLDILPTTRTQSMYRRLLVHTELQFSTNNNDEVLFMHIYRGKEDGRVRGDL